MARDHKNLYVVVAGSRNMVNQQFVYRALDHLLKEYEPKNLAIVSGCAKGPDTFGKEWADAHHVRVLEYPADWDNLGNSAGYVRNAEMAKVGTHCVIFWDGKSKGTKHMIDLATDRGLVVKVFILGPEHFEEKRDESHRNNQLDLRKTRRNLTRDTKHSAYKRSSYASDGRTVRKPDGKISSGTELYPRHDS